MPPAAILTAGLIGSRSEAPFIGFLLIHERKLYVLAANVLLPRILLFSPEVVALGNKRDVRFQKKFYIYPDPNPP